MLKNKRKYQIVTKIIFLYLLLLPQALWAQYSNMQVENFSINNGLSQSVVTCILVDKFGFIWVGTQDGLNRYDGYQFDTYRYSPYNNNSLSSNYIQAMCEDKNGNIWIATQNGLNKFDRNAGLFYRFMNEANNPNSLFENDTYFVYIDSEGFIWIKTYDWLERFNPQTNEFKHYDYEHNPFTSATHSNNFSIFEDSNKRLWIGSKDGLFYLDRNSDQLIGFKYDENNETSISNNEIRDIYEDSQKNLYVATSNGLNLWLPNKKCFQRFFYAENKSYQIERNTINKVMQDSLGRVWLATVGGLLYFDKENACLKSFHNADLATVLSEHETILTLSTDNSNLLWLGTWEKGLVKLDISTKKFSKFNFQNIYENISTISVASIYKENENEMWIGTWGYGIYKLFNNSGEVVRYTSMHSGNYYVPFSYAYTILKDYKSQIWVGTNIGLFCYDAEKEQFIEYKNKYGNAPFANNRINAIMEDNQKNLWFATEKGVHCLSNDSLTSYFNNIFDNNSISSDFTYDIIQDSEGFIWVGSRDGLNKIDVKNNIFERFGVAFSSKNGLSHEKAVSLLEDSNGNIWIGTQSGLNCFHKDTETFEFFIQSDGFANDFIYTIIEDNNGALWISTNRGISLFNYENRQITNFDITDGLQGFEFNLGAAYKAPNGEIFFGGSGGFNFFYPDSIRFNPHIPAVAITKCEILEKNSRKKTIEIYNTADTLIIQNNDYMFTIFFAALEYTRTERNQYQYKLVGYSDNWVSLGNQRYISFPKLAPGEYTFLVKGSNNDNLWNENPVSLTIIVKPGIFNHPLSYITYLLVVVTLFVTFYRYRTKSLRRANQILKEKEKAGEVVKQQKEQLAIKNKNITDSITYAKRIIEAMMPSEKAFKKTLKDSFLIYLPKDIVSGDFYWVLDRNDKIFVAAVDCTGHGVPGALMSIIGYDLLKNITVKQGIEEPAKILDSLNNGISDTFKLNADDDSQKVADGMDLSFCVIDYKNYSMEYAGAFNPIYMVRDSNLIEIKANRFAVGMAKHGDEVQLFTNHVIPLQSGDVIYMFSDGYADQFGGPKGKKFKYRRFKHLLLTIHHQPMQKQQEILINSINNWKGDREQVDDILIIGLRIP